jgi:hypothetical protein
LRGALGVGLILTLHVAGVAAAAPAEPASSGVRYVDVWGPALGAELPLLQAQDHTGTVRTLADLTGDQGLLLFLVRSADW